MLQGESQQPVCGQIAALLPGFWEAGQMDEGLMRQAFQVSTFPAVYTCELSLYSTYTCISRILWVIVG